MTPAVTTIRNRPSRETRSCSGCEVLPSSTVTMASMKFGAAAEGCTSANVILTVPGTPKRSRMYFTILSRLAAVSPVVGAGEAGFLVVDGDAERGGGLGEF